MSRDYLAPKNDSDFVSSKRWLALGILMIAQFMYIADLTIVLIAVPAIQKELKADFAAVQWITAGYALSYAVALITGGRLGDIFGRKRIFIYGLGGFSIASTMCGLALTSNFLIASRIFQGLTVALMMPQVLSIIQLSFPSSDERSTAFGIFSAVSGVSGTASIPLCSLLIQTDLLNLGWRSLFLINLPLGLLALLASPLIRESRSPVPLKVDWIGVTMVSVGLFTFIYPLVGGRKSGWSLWIFLCLVFAVLILIFFVYYQLYLSKQKKSPLIELSLFKNYSFVVGILITLVMYLGMFSFYLIMTVYLQSGLQLTVMQAGLVFTPLAITIFIAAVASMKLERYLGSRLVIVGTAIMAVSMLLFNAIVHQLAVSPPIAELMIAMSVFGIGQGLAVPTLLNSTLAKVRETEAGSASGILTTVQQISNAFGVAVVGIVFFGILDSTSSELNLQQYNRALFASLLCNFSLLTLAFLLSFFLQRYLSTKRTI
ncbi:MFS transporter [Pleurocapsa sp. PCC 7319]|uniref:MFS transporter n=1 Tax=Pleurocapsa sp. PCC 7319 TaxID=118161 RepID=UPI000346ABE9|nr:MFS transporter [Pleurocapsa sp. PCC 7319]